MSKYHRVSIFFLIPDWVCEAALSRSGITKLAACWTRIHGSSMKARPSFVGPFLQELAVRSSQPGDDIRGAQREVSGLPSPDGPFVPEVRCR